MGKKTDLTGKVFGRLTVLEDSGWGKWICLCECGNLTKVLTGSLNNGNTRSCGCLKTEKATKHGLSRSPHYKRWEGMRHRCYDPKNNAYKNYGGRGITICEEWKDDVAEFVGWCGEQDYMEGLEIDRIDNDGGYSPANCHFVSPAINSLNRRVSKNNTSGLRGVYLMKQDGTYCWQLTNLGVKYYKHQFKTAQEASDARDDFIIEKGFWHKLNRDS